MKILIVCSKIAPFVQEQVDALKKEGIEFETFLIEGRGIAAYIRARKPLISFIKKTNPDLIHAHYGLSGFLANLQFKKPVITTFHGSDINVFFIRFFSQIAVFLSKESIFVSEKLKKKVFSKQSNTIIPCGIDLQVFVPMDKEMARKQLGYKPDEKLVLFSNAFDNAVKNYPLAKAAISRVKGVRLLELKGYTRENVCLLLNAVDVALMTSFTEGSPQFIKEAMACNCPIVSTDVGDVKNLIEKEAGCFICSYDENDLAIKLQLALDFGKRTSGRQKIVPFDNRLIARKIKDIYNRILHAGSSK